MLNVDFLKIVDDFFPAIRALSVDNLSWKLLQSLARFGDQFEQKSDDSGKIVEHSTVFPAFDTDMVCKDRAQKVRRI